jgi:hypothetical protein
MESIACRGDDMMQRRAFHKTLLNLRTLGFARTLHDMMLKAINSFITYKVLKCVTISRVDAGFLKSPDGYTPMFLSPSMLRKFAKDPAYELSESFLEEAESKGDECYAICDGETLAAYGWYSFRPTRIDPPDVLIHFSSEYVYMYKGFTHTSYRGQRLHAIAMSLALQSYRSRGYEGLVSYIESNNFDSLKSCARMGYVIFGTAYIGKIFGRHFQHCSRGCEKLGFRLERASPVGSHPSAASAS